MNTAMSKANFVNSEANIYSWQFNTIETPYQKHSLDCCDYCERGMREPSLLSGRTLGINSSRSN